jgi:hypothetical protein
VLDQQLTKKIIAAQISAPAKSSTVRGVRIVSRQQFQMGPLMLPSLQPLLLVCKKPACIVAPADGRTMPACH